MGVMMNSWSILPFPTQAGQVGGHEGVGKIVKLGPGADNASVKVGDRVGIKWMAGICLNCEACRAGMDGNCFNGVRFPDGQIQDNPSNGLTCRKSRDTTPQGHSSNMCSVPPTTVRPCLYDTHTPSNLSSQSPPSPTASTPPRPHLSSAPA